MAKMLHDNNITSYNELVYFIKVTAKESGMEEQGELLITKLRQFTLLFSTETLTTDLNLPLDDSEIALSTDSLNRSIELILMLDKFV